MGEVDLLGKYETRGVLGRGAMGTVYDAWDPRIDRRVAIKTVRRPSGEDDEDAAEALARFRQEARAAGRLSHPNIVGVYDFGETDDFAYIVMEFVEGRTLKSRLDEAGRLLPAEAGRIMLGVLSGLSYSHARGVVHRDIKPANIMLTGEGEAKIADFGVARLENSDMTSVGTMIGTPSYMAPEQFLGEGVDARSDIYAAGVTLFHMLTGARPYEGGMTAIMHRVLKVEEPAPRAAERLPGINPLLDAAVARGMAKVAANRFEDAAAFSLALRIALAAPDAAADEDATVFGRAGLAGRDGPARPAETIVPSRTGPPPARTPSPPRAARRVPVALLGLAASVLLVAGGVAAWFALGGRATTTPPFPSSPPESPASLPAAPPAGKAATPAPQPVPVPPPPPAARDVAQAIGRMLAARPCLLAQARVDGADGVAVAGVGSAQAVAAARTDAEATRSGLTLSWSVTGFDGPYCGAVDLLRRDAGEGPLRVALAGGATVLHDEQDILPEIAAPAFPAFLRVDYLSHDGSVAHLYPPPGTPTRLQPGTVLRLPKSLTGKVGPPFGTDMILAVASNTSLALRRKLVEPTDAYLVALHGAITAARDKGGQIAGGAMALRTVPK